MIHPVASKSEVAMLQPVLVSEKKDSQEIQRIHNEPLSSISFREDAIVTTDRLGYVKLWNRPPTTE